MGDGLSMKTTGIDAVRKKFQELHKFLESQEPMQKTVDEVKETILEKTLRGLDYSGRRFEPYSKEYADRRRKKGLSTKPNLRVTGEMLDSIKAEVISPTQGKVSVTGTGRSHERIQLPEERVDPGAGPAGLRRLRPMHSALPRQPRHTGRAQEDNDRRSPGSQVQSPESETCWIIRTSRFR